MKRVLLIVLVAGSLLTAPVAAHAFSLVSMQPHYDRYEVYTTEPLVLVFDSSLNAGTVGTDAVTVTQLDTAAPVAGTIVLGTTNLANDTLTFSPDAGQFVFGRRLQVTVSAAIEDMIGGAFDGVLPSQGVFVANIPDNLDVPEPDEVFNAPGALLGYNPIDPEGTDPARYWEITGTSITEA